MNVVKIMGGLGNQLFQIAFAYSLFEGKNICVDASVYKTYKIRDYSLAHFVIYDEIKQISEAEMDCGWYMYKLSSKIYHVIQKILFPMENKYNILGKLYLVLSKLGYYYNFSWKYIFNKSKNKTNNYIYGYFQSEKYFYNKKNLIKEKLKVKELMDDIEKNYFEDIKLNDSVGVSMRLGDDYRQSRILNVCTDEYYLQGMRYIHNINPNVKFYIFSDDLERAKKIKFDFDVCFIPELKDYQSLRLLSSCKYFVIANSSFSWWGAYLSSYKNKVIVAPKRWYNGMENPDIYTDDMVKLEGEY